LYRHRDEEEAKAFIEKLLTYLNPLRDALFLDLACGRGRHSMTIAESGYRVVGADLSRDNIRAAKEASQGQVEFVVHDMRLPLAKDKFDYVVNLFTSFGYFESIEENEDVLRAIHTELKPKGKVVIDFLNVDQVADELVPAEERTIDGVTFSISRQIENDSIVKRINVKDGASVHSFEERVKALTKTQFIGMFNRLGFEVLDIFGSYRLEAFEPQISPRLILIGRKP
jgi:SAM-dependent methyltransferase